MLVTAIMLWLALRGLVEGMIMIQFRDTMYGGDPDKNEEGVRCHKWFPWYHWLCITRDGCLVAVVILFSKFHGEYVLIAGAAILGWELFEAVYNFTRYRVFITGHENVLGCWNLSNGADVWLLNSFRFLIGAGLIIWGLQ